MPRLRPLATLAPSSRRFILVCYAQQQGCYREVYAKLQDQAWAPTPADCPVPWADLETWYQGVERTGQLVMDSY